MFQALCRLPSASQMHFSQMGLDPTQSFKASMTLYVSKLAFWGCFSDQLYTADRLSKIATTSLDTHKRPPSVQTPTSRDSSPCFPFPKSYSTYH